MGVFMEENSNASEERKDVRISENITLGADGKYRWVYSVNLFTNPIFLLLVWKIFFFIVLGIFAFTTVVDVIDWGGFSWDLMKGQLKVFGIIFGVMTALVLVGYLLYAAIMRGKYTVEFEMDEKGTTAAAVTSVKLVLSLGADNKVPFVIKCNRPYLIFLTQYCPKINKTLLLFCAKIENP